MKPDIEAPEPGVYSVLLNGRSYEARVDGTAIEIDGYRFEIETSDPRAWRAKAGGRSGEEVQTVAAPMPGKVIRLLAAPGDLVEAGQGLLVVEAMKMQNEIRAPRAGRLISIAAREGATVVAGEVLATIE